MMSGLIKNILLLFALCAFCITTYAQLEKYTAVSANDLDRYGGYQGLSFEAKGYFYLLHDGYRYWLVTPDGNAFISHGINHVERKWMQRFYNIDYWARKYNITDYSDRRFNDGFLKKVSEDLDKIGWNTLGCHNPINYNDPGYPYVNLIPYVKTIRFVNIHHAQPHHHKDDFPDVWSKDYYNHCDQLAKEIAGTLKDDPYLLGYFMTDCPILTEKDAAPRGNNIYGRARPRSPTWPHVIRSLHGDAPGKKRYVNHMKSRYNNSIKAFNSVYNSDFQSFSELQNATDWRFATDLSNEMELEDNFSFLLKILDRRYKVETEAIRKYDPHHLILGDKFNGNTQTPKEILKIAANYTDLIFIQHYAFWDELEDYLNKIADATQKPILMGDASVHVPYDNLPDPFGPQSANQQARIEDVKTLYLNAFKRDDFLGWHWCGWMDDWEASGNAGKQHGGIQDPFGNFHPVAEFLSEFSKKMYYIVIEGDE